MRAAGASDGRRILSGLSSGVAALVLVLVTSVVLVVGGAASGAQEAPVQPAPTDPAAQTTTTQTTITSASTTAVPSTTTGLGRRATESDTASDRLDLVVVALFVLAGIITVVTVVFWQMTRPGRTAATTEPSMHWVDDTGEHPVPVRPDAHSLTWSEQTSPTWHVPNPELPDPTVARSPAFTPEPRPTSQVGWAHEPAEPGRQPEPIGRAERVPAVRLERTTEGPAGTNPFVAAQNREAERRPVEPIEPPPVARPAFDQRGARPAVAASTEADRVGVRVIPDGDTEASPTPPPSGKWASQGWDDADWNAPDAEAEAPADGG